MENSQSKIFLPSQKGSSWNIVFKQLGSLKAYSSSNKEDVFFSHGEIIKKYHIEHDFEEKRKNQEEVFQQVYKFVYKLINEECFLDQLLEHLYSLRHQFEKNSMDLQGGNSCNELEEKKIPQNTQIRKSIRNSIELQMSYSEKNIISLYRKNQKITNKISSFIMSDSEQSFDSFISEDEEIPNFDSFILDYNLSVLMIKRMFIDSETELITLSLCLFVKFLAYSIVKVQNTNWSWILSISTLIAYKIGYDKTIESLISDFASILSVSQEAIKNLEKYFLNQIQFEVFINEEHYKTILLKMISL